MVGIARDGPIGLAVPPDLTPLTSPTAVSLPSQPLYKFSRSHCFYPVDDSRVRRLTYCCGLDIDT